MDRGKVEVHLGPYGRAYGRAQSHGMFGYMFGGWVLEQALCPIGKASMVYE